LKRGNTEGLNARCVDFWLPAPHTAALVFFLSSVPLAFIWPRCCGSNRPRLSVSKKQQALTLIITLILYGIAVFCLWYSTCTLPAPTGSVNLRDSCVLVRADEQRTANNYNLLVLIFSFVPLLQFLSTRMNPQRIGSCFTP
jgi:hypothetical protein